MKTFVSLIVFFTILFTSEVQAQMVVNDPLNASINATIQTLSESSNMLQSFLSETKALELATSGLSQLQSIQEVAKLVDDLGCMTTEFNMLMNIDQNYSCTRFLNFRLVNINLNYTTELLTGVILSKNLFTMSSEGRLANLNTVKETLERTIKEMQTISSALKSNLVQKEYKKYIKNQYYSSLTKSATYNRYSNR